MKKSLSGFIRGDGGIIVFKLRDNKFVSKYVKNQKPAFVCSLDLDGYVDGEAVQYYPSGKLYLVLNFSHGHLEGVQKAYTIKGEQGIGDYTGGEMLEGDSVYESVTADIPTTVTNVNIKCILDYLRDFVDDLDDLED